MDNDFMNLSKYFNAEKIYCSGSWSRPKI